MRVLRLSAVLLPEREIRFPPNPVNTLRGALGFQLKRLACFQKVHERTTCHGCPAEAACVYAACFETGGQDAARPAAFGGNLDLPHLLVLEARFSAAAAIPAGQAVTFGLALFGRAVEAVPWMVQALRETARVGLTTERVPCRLAAVTADSGVPLYDPETERLQPWVPERLVLPVPDPADRAADRVTVRFLTPTSFKDKATGRVRPEVEFHRLVMSLCRRLTAFVTLDGGSPPPWDFAALARLAREVRVVASDLEFAPWERFSTKQAARIRFGGVLGRVTYAGPLRPFRPLLEAGQWLRVGRGTSFGQGRYVLEAAETAGGKNDFEPVAEGHLSADNRPAVIAGQEGR